MKLKMGAVTYKITIEELEDDEMGRMNPKRNLIQIDSTMRKEQQRHTLAHEIAHLFIRWVRGDPEEGAAETMGHLIMMLLSNKEVVKWLQDSRN